MGVQQKNRGIFSSLSEPVVDPKETENKEGGGERDGKRRDKIFDGRRKQVGAN